MFGYGGIYMPVELTKGIYWVGYVDWALRHFHGFELSTHRGSSYNAYLILDQKNVLVDTVWSPFSAELIKNISEIIDPDKIDIVVVNHSESDHSSALPALMQHIPQAPWSSQNQGEKASKGIFTNPGIFGQFRPETR